MNTQRVQFLSLCCGLVASISSGQQLFWTDGNLFAIKRAAFDGTALAVVAAGKNYTYLAYDPVARMIYYSLGDPVPALWRSRPDGSSPELLQTFDTHNYFRGLAIDAVSAKIYWSSSDGYVAGNGKIRRANLDGTGVEDLVNGMIYPYGLALDMAGGKMFWIRQENNSIWRANLDGSESQALIDLGPLSYAFCLALDAANSRLYWTDPGDSTISSANLDGTDIQQIATLDPSSLDAGITIDPGPDGQWRSLGIQPLIGGGAHGSAALFWADTFNHNVYTAALDGTGVRLFRETEPNYAQTLLVVRNWEIAVSVSRVEQGARLSWNSREGLGYHVEGKSEPSGTWSNISGRLVASGLTTSWTDPNSNSNALRLYRVVME